MGKFSKRISRLYQNETINSISAALFVLSLTGLFTTLYLASKNIISSALCVSVDVIFVLYMLWHFIVMYICDHSDKGS